jgi:hypothetical protein
MALVVLAISVAACSTPAASSPPAMTGAAASAPLIPADFPLIGTWVTSITKDDLAAAGLVDPGAQNENSGRFTWTFNADGTWTTVQESLDGSPINSPVFRGTYAISGSELVATTQFPEQYADSGLRYTWELDGDAVTFDLLNPPDETLPLIIETNAWMRQS